MRKTEIKETSIVSSHRRNHKLLMNYSNSRSFANPTQHAGLRLHLADRNDSADVTWQKKDFFF